LQSVSLAVSAAMLASLAIPGGSNATAMFTPVGSPSLVVGISGDGRVIVGQADGTAFYWTAAGGLQLLPRTASGGQAADASYDGTVIVGGTPDDNPADRAARWNSFGTAAFLGAPSPSTATAISADGSTIVGAATGSGPFRWTEATGAQPLGFGFYSVNDISADGSVIVGAQFENGGLRALRWSEATGPQLIGPLQSNAAAVSADGNVVALAAGLQFALWTESGGFVPLGNLSPTADCAGLGGISGDGSVIVGTGGHANDQGQCQATIWDEIAGIRELQVVLESGLGLDLPGWSLTEVAAISDDGRTIAGTGYNPDGQREGWVAFSPTGYVGIVPEPSPSILLVSGIAVLGLIDRARKRQT
jgi:uncharacterized membrane protein